jgi:FkbM family methyltransferase
MNALFSLRIQKLAYSITHPACWRPLRHGVAPAIEHRKALMRMECDMVIDVGGNRGQFSLISRIIYPNIPIESFEPIPAEADIFRKALSGKGVRLHQVALGERAGEADIHLSRSADSSSLLPIGREQRRLFHGTEEVGKLTIAVKRLDDMAMAWRKYARILLKIDVQGYELFVLKGAVEMLKSCAYVYVECSETELYVGQALYNDVAEFLERHGFRFHSRFNDAIVNGKLVQADYLFGKA